MNDPTSCGCTGQWSANFVASDGTILSLLHRRLHHCRTAVCVGMSRQQAELAGFVGEVIGNQLACRSLSERFAYRAGAG